MKFRRCYDVALAGRPSSSVDVLPEPQVLHLPLWSRRFSFSRLCVKDGQKVEPGRVLAEDPANYSIPLLAPRKGTVRLERVENHVTLEGVSRVPEQAYEPDENSPHAPKGMGSVGMKRYKLVGLGAWQFFREAHGGALPDPFGTPRAVIVSTLSLEPFQARGAVHIGKRLESFTRGLEHIQSLLEYQPIYLVLPDVESDLAERVRQTVRGYAWVTVVTVPLNYPSDNVGVVARKLGLKHSEPGPVWAVGAGGVLAVDRALTLSLPSTVRLFTMGGPGAEEPRHLLGVTGYPLKAILGERTDYARWRVLNGGALTGERLDPRQAGLDAECEGLTIVREHEGREFLGFMRPGLGKRSYSNCFVSVLRGVFPQRQDTALNGEPRACISCQFCEEVCPCGLMPHLIHKCLYRDDLEEAERAGIDLCVDCGLCTYVCPSKIELRSQLIEGRQRVRSELHPEEVGP
jgi:Na(+)-translocating NADH:ubiquinone oxidoreductase A subunit